MCRIGAVWWYTGGRPTQYSRSRSKSKENGTGVLRAAKRSMPASETEIGDMPGGAPTHFCVQEYA